MTKNKSIKNQKTSKKPMTVDLSSHKVFFEVLEAGGRDMDYYQFKNAVYKKLQNQKLKK
tara:strand:+ start:90 stop:266 length:177 start_codon:yes stop_codon:yes gene_type:complete